MNTIKWVVLMGFDNNPGSVKFMPTLGYLKAAISGEVEDSDFIGLGIGLQL